MFHDSVWMPGLSFCTAEVLLEFFEKPFHRRPDIIFMIKNDN